MFKIAHIILTHSVLFHRGSTYSYTIWGINNMAARGRTSEMYSHPIDMNNRVYKNVSGPKKQFTATVMGCIAQSFPNTATIF
jgi:hypothetical protein